MAHHNNDHTHPLHEHEHCCHTHHRKHNHGTALTIRPTSGLSGDMLLAGFATMARLQQKDLDALVDALKLPALQNCARLEPREVNSIAGVGCTVTLPHEHAHRNLTDITTLIDNSVMEPRAKELSIAAFQLLAQAEGAVHGRPVTEVHFHEVGALDSILDICIACALFVRLNPTRFVCGALPMADGGVHCAHGWLPSPAPAVLHLLRDVPVRPFPAQPDGKGETVTPTALALLKTFKAEFGQWPSMTVHERAIAYGTRVFTNAPNGAVFALGSLS